MPSKMVNILDGDEGITNQEMRILLKSLKPRMKLPLLNDYDCKDCYPEQLIAEHYLDELLEGYMLKFTTTRSKKYLGVETPHLKMDERLMNIIMTISV